MKFKLLGAVDGSVTGSCTYFQYDRTNTKFLVDCGMVQGEPHAPATNGAQFPFNPSELKFVLLTHAHLDHCGLIPRLYKEGFTGQVICTEATAKLARISLFDAANYCGNLYSKEHVKAINFFHIDQRSDFGFYRFIPIDDELFACFTRSAHILGAVSISISWHVTDDEKKVITMSGDIGNNTKENPYQSLLAHKQIPPTNSNYIVSESTYGERARDEKFKSHNNRIEAIQSIIESESLKKGKLVVFPAFSIHRTQEIMLDIVQVLSGPGKNSFGVVKERPLPKGLVEKIKNNLWDKGDQNHIEKLLLASDEQDKQYWLQQIETKTLSKGKKNPRERFFLINDEMQDRFIQHLCSVELPEFRILHIESGMAQQINKVYATELNKRQRYKPEELLQRNRRLTEYFDVPTEEEVDSIIDNIFDSENANPHEVIGIHGINTGIKKNYLDNRERYNNIVVTGSGMCDGGPITDHLQEILTSEKVCIVITGFMAYGTAGAGLKAIHDKRALLATTEEDPEGKTLVVNLPNGKRIKEEDVKATIIDLSSYYPGHADQADLVKHIMDTSEAKFSDLVAEDVTVFINHGTQSSREVLRDKLLEYAGDNKRDVRTVLLPEKNNKLFDLNAGEYSEEEISRSSSENKDIAELHSEMVKIRKLLELLVDKIV